MPKPPVAAGTAARAYGITALATSSPSCHVPGAAGLARASWQRSGLSRKSQERVDRSLDDAARPWLAHYGPPVMCGGGWQPWYGWGSAVGSATHELRCGSIRSQSRAQKWCSEMVIFGPFCSRFTKSPRRSFRTNVRNMFIMHRLNITSTHLVTAYRKRLRNGSICARKRRL